MKSIGLQFSQLSWAMVTHFHLDHAGLLTDFMESGIQCLIFENQSNSIEEMERIIHKNYPYYKDIDQSKLRMIKTSQSRSFLDQIGIKGAVILTPGHSDDSISFITDDHEAIIGDLPPIDQLILEEDQWMSSWDKIIESGAKTIYPSHANFFEI